MSKFKKNIFGSAVYPPRPKKIVRVYNDRINGYMQEFTDAAERLSSYQNKVRIVFPQFFKVTEYDDGSKEKVNDYRKD